MDGNKNVNFKPLPVATPKMFGKNQAPRSQKIVSHRNGQNGSIPTAIYYNKQTLLYQQLVNVQQYQRQQHYQQQLNLFNYQQRQQAIQHHWQQSHQMLLNNGNTPYHWSSLVASQQQQHRAQYKIWPKRLQFTELLQDVEQGMQQPTRVPIVSKRQNPTISTKIINKPTKNTFDDKTKKANVENSTMTTVSENLLATIENDDDIEKSATPRKKIKQTLKDDTVQRNSSKVGHTNNHHQHHHHHRKSRKDHQQTLMKNDSSDSGISINGHQQQRHRQHQNRNQNQNQNQQQQHHRNNNTKQLKTRCNNKQQQQQDGHQRQMQKNSSGFSMDDWLENGKMVYYERRRFISSSEEDKLGHRHNTAHRNSTSSETAPSEDLTTSSSNEDLRDTYTVSPKCKKNMSKSRQRRQQQKRKKQLSESGNSNQDENEEAMDIDVGSIKENCRPNNGGAQQRNGMKTLRQENSKNSTQKVSNACNGNKNSKKSGNVLKNSNSNTTNKRTGGASQTSSSSSSAISSSSAENSPMASPTTCKRNAENIKKIALKLQTAPPLRSHMSMNFSEKELIEHLRRYIIDPNLLRVYGFPVESAIHDGCIEIYKCLPKPQNATGHHHHHHHNNHHNGQQSHTIQSQCFMSNTSVINANDGLYVSVSTSFKKEYKQKWITIDDTSNSSTDSGQGSGDSSPPSMDSDTSEGAEDEPSGTTALYTPDGSYQIFSQYDQSMEKQCVRCNSTFHVTATGEYLNRESCTFHWGKLNQIYSGDKGYCYQYQCCQGDHESQGCVYNDLHVWTGAVVGLNGPYTDFVYTRPRYDSTGPTKVYALDCEMSFTGRGLEVTKITVVGYDGQLVYEHFVRPDAEIVDYNTRFSGITENDLGPNSNKSVKTLTEVQRDLLRLIDADTILIGHGLDNDLRVLRIVHKTIIDTSICFPHTSGFPYRRALKHLTKLYLNRDIQTSDAGHSSFEDSRACLELMLWKVRKEMR